MTEFALVFRLTRSLDGHELERRSVIVRDWALDLRKRGTIRTTVVLEGDGIAILPDRSESSVGGLGVVGAVNVIDVADMDAALAVARSHPGLDFGTSVEVRRVKPLVLPPGT